MSKLLTSPGTFYASPNPKQIKPFMAFEIKPQRQIDMKIATIAVTPFTEKAGRNNYSYIVYINIDSSALFIPYTAQLHNLERHFETYIKWLHLPLSTSKIDNAAFPKLTKGNATQEASETWCITVSCQWETCTALPAFSASLLCGLPSLPPLNWLFGGAVSLCRWDCCCGYSWVMTICTSLSFLSTALLSSRPIAGIIYSCSVIRIFAGLCGECRNQDWIIFQGDNKCVIFWQTQYVSWD